MTPGVRDLNIRTAKGRAIHSRTGSRSPRSPNRSPNGTKTKGGAGGTSSPTPMPQDETVKEPSTVDKLAEYWGQLFPQNDGGSFLSAAQSYAKKTVKPADDNSTVFKAAAPVVSSVAVPRSGSVTGFRSVSPLRPGSVGLLQTSTTMGVVTSNGPSSNGQTPMGTPLGGGRGAVPPYAFGGAPLQLGTAARPSAALGASPTDTKLPRSGSFAMLNSPRVGDGSFALPPNRGLLPYETNVMLTQRGLLQGLTSGAAMESPRFTRGVGSFSFAPHATLAKMQDCFRFYKIDYSQLPNNVGNHIRLKKRPASVYSKQLEKVTEESKHSVLSYFEGHRDPEQREFDEKYHRQVSARG